MQWLNKIVDEVIARKPDGEILIESGGSPSGTYHLGHLRELLICDAILLELQRRGRQAKHVYFVDDLDGLRKIPVDVPSSYEKYLGRSLCDIPAPDGSKQSYAGYFIQGLIDSSKKLHLEMEFVSSHEKYQTGFFSVAIEKALENLDEIRNILEKISGHKLGEDWSPIQINEAGYLKKRRFVSIDTKTKTLVYSDKNGQEQTVSYDKGLVKLDWRIDWPARWWLLKVDVEPAGRDHSSSGGSFDTGMAILKKVFKAPDILPIQYDFINLVGDTKKMSASKGTGLDAISTVTVLPPEIVRYLILRAPPSKRLYFDPENGVAQLIDEYAELLAKDNKSADEQQLVAICNRGIDPTISSLPFTQLVAAYQASLKDSTKTIELLERTNAKTIPNPEKETIKDELVFIDEWLKNWSPEDIRFELAEKIESSEFNDAERKFLEQLASRIEQAPADADGEWFHKAVYDLKDSVGLEPKAMFQTLYQALIGKDYGPRAGWFLSILPRQWLIKRLRLEA